MAHLRHILPVIDVQGGNVVHGVGGDRDAYAPIRSQIVTSSDPLTVATQLCKVLDNRQLYVADLDALTGIGSPCWEALSAISARGISIWLDAGIVSLEGGQALFRLVPNSRWIVSLESLPSLGCISELLEHVPAHQIVFSLDLKSAVPISPNDQIRQMSAEAIGRTAIEAGIETMIVLDLAAVGTAKVLLTVELCERLKSRYPHVALVSGGGVRNAEDIQRFVTAGCSHVLVATALHNGTLLNGDL